MGYDHILIDSGKGDYNSSGISELLNLYNPRTVLLFYQGELKAVPDELRNEVVNTYDGEFPPEVKLTALGDATSELGIQSMPYTIFQEMQSAISEHLPEHLSDEPTEHELVITIMAGSGLHQQLLLGLAIALKATIVTIDRGTAGTPGTPVITSQEWIGQGLNPEDMTNAQKDLLRAFLIQLTRAGAKDETIRDKMSADELLAGLEIHTVETAGGISNTAAGLINRGLIEVTEDSSPVLYRLTGRGWVVALLTLTEELDGSGMPLHGLNAKKVPELATLYRPSHGVEGRVASVRGVLSNGRLNAVSIANNLPLVHTVMTIYSRRHDEMTPKMIVDDGFDLSDEERGSFLKVRKEWVKNVQSRHQFHIDWALFNAIGAELEESFRILCQWLWPRITGSKFMSSDNQRRDINWSIESTHLDLQQTTCMSLISFLHSIPLTYLLNPMGGRGVTERSRRLIANPSWCVITMPNRELASALLASGSNWKDAEKILVALWLREKDIHLELNEHRSELRNREPFEEVVEKFEPRPRSAHIKELHTWLEKKIQEGGIHDRFRIDDDDLNEKTKTATERRSKKWGRAGKKLTDHGLTIWLSAQKRTSKLLELTPLGRIVAELLYHRHSRE
jgi:hypothetical protein